MGFERTAWPRIKLDHCDRFGARPISEIAARATLRFQQAHGAVGQIIFDIGQAENVLANQARRAGVAAADDKICFGDIDARQRKILGDRDSGGNVPANTLHAEPDWRGFDMQAKFRGAGGGNGAVKRTAIQNEVGFFGAETCGDQWLATRHGDGEFGDFANLTRRHCRNRGQQCHDRRKQTEQSHGIPRAERGNACHRGGWKKRNTIPRRTPA